MIRARLILIVLIVVFGGAAPVAFALPEVDHQLVKLFLSKSNDKDYYARGVFEKDLVSALRSSSDVEKAATKLGPKYGLSQSAMERLVRLWVIWVLHREYALFDGVPYEQREAMRGQIERELRRMLLELVRDTKHAPAVVRQAALELSYEGSCALDDFKALLDGAPDSKAVARIAAEVDCDRWGGAINQLVPMNPAVLWGLTSGAIAITHEQQLAALETLTTSSEVALLPEPQRLALRIALARRHIYALWDGGLTEEGLAFFEAQSEPVRRALLDERQPEAGIIKFDGFAIDLTSERTNIANAFESWGSYFKLELAAALYATNHDREAREVFAAFPFSTQAAKAMACTSTDKTEPQDCPRDTAAIFRAWYVLDFAIARHDADPYDVAEFEFVSFNDGAGKSGSGTWARMLRKLLAGDSYAGVREAAAKRWRLWWRSPEDADMPGLFDATVDDAFRGRVAHFADGIRQARVAMNLTPEEPDPWQGRTGRGGSPGASAYRFAQHKIGKPCAQPEKDAADDKLSPAADGHMIVRLERAGAIAVAVSLSQNLDPVGEVSGGGYWIHVSRDGGATWGAPRYTGLAQYFPYEVVAPSCKPMWAGDHLEIEVEINELDRASITYPPVGLQAKRRERGLYLHVPLAELERDGDGDLITDIEEEHLLLDAKRADTDGDGLRDGVDPIPNVPRRSARRPTDDAMQVVLAEIFGKGSFGAIIEGIGESGDSLESYLERTRSTDAASRGRPIFVTGRPEDFASLRPAQMMLVYSGDDIARLETMTPVFAAVGFQPLTLNRAGTKGFITWSAGWVGGTFRLLREGDGWRAVPISSWIT